MDSKPLSICFTGHRPNRLPGGYDWDHPDNQAIIKKMKRIVWNLIKDDLEKGVQFYFGGAIGIDQMAFDMCLKLKQKEICPVELILCIPFEKQYVQWNKMDQSRYLMHKRMADKVVYVDEVGGYVCPQVEVGEFHVAKMHLRNQYMIDPSDIVISVWSGMGGGTGSATKYALKENKHIIRLNPTDLSITDPYKP